MPNGVSRGYGSALFPVDLVLVGGLGLWAIMTSAGQLGETPGQLAIGFAAVLIAPGYALAAALFPDGGPWTGTLHGWIGDSSPDDGHISFVERIVLSLALSVCLVPLLGLGLNFTPWGIQPSLFVGAVGATTVIFASIAAVRRWRASPEDRYDPRLSGLLSGVRKKVGTSPASSNWVVILTVGLLLAVSGIGFAVIDADRGERFTEFYLLTEDPQTGELVANGYPREITRGEPARVHVGIGNHEGRTMSYTVTIVLQRLTDEHEIQENQTLDSYAVTLADGETVEEPHQIRPEMTGTDLRLTYLLYRGQGPENATPSTDSAYRTVHIWIDVLPSETE